MPGADPARVVPAGSRVRSVTLRWKVAGLIILPMLFVLGVSTTLAYNQQRRQSLESMSLLASQTGEVIENVLQRDMLVSDFERIQASFDAIGSDPRIRTLYLLDTQGKVIFAPGGEDVGLQLENTLPSCLPCHQSSADERPSGVVVEDAEGQSVFRSMQPVENRPECTRCHDPELRFLGLLLTDLSIEPVESALTLDLQRNIAWWMGTVIVTGLLANFAVHRWVLRRLGTIASAMERLGNQNPTGRLPESPEDEIGRLSRAFNTMAERLETRDRDNETLSQELRALAQERGELLGQVITAQEDERKRLSRELHDELGQELSSTALTIELAQRSILLEPDAARESLERARHLIGEATGRMDELILGLRPPALDDLGLEAALRSLAARVLKPAGIEFRIEASGGQDRLPPAIETAVFRILQEGLTNVLRHARAGRVAIRLHRQQGSLIGEVEDDGVGFDPGGERARRLGLLGMRERAAQLGGTVEVRSARGKGSTVTVRIPLREATHG